MQLRKRRTDTILETNSFLKNQVKPAKEGSKVKIKKEDQLEPTPLKRKKIEIGYEESKPLLEQAHLVKQENDGHIVKLESPEKKTRKKAPLNWEETFQKIKLFRLDHEAPVDTVGCERLADSPYPQIFRYEILTSLQLSSQTKDPVTAQAIANLKADPDGGLTIDNVLNMPIERLNQHICKVGFHTRKTTYLRETAKILKEKYQGDIPSTLEALLDLPGIGPKMAHLVMQCAWNETVGIGVDTHVHRISNRLGWVKTNLPEKTRIDLEDWLPKQHWREINALLVGFGQVHCKPINPECPTCPVAHLCPKIGTRKVK